MVDSKYENVGTTSKSQYHTLTTYAPATHSLRGLRDDSHNHLAKKTPFFSTGNHERWYPSTLYPGEPSVPEVPLSGGDKDTGPSDGLKHIANVAHRQNTR